MSEPATALEIGVLEGDGLAAPSINSSQTQAMAQAVHCAATDIAGGGIANPTAMILSCALLLRWLADRRADPALADAARRVEDAVVAVAREAVLARLRQ